MYLCMKLHIANLGLNNLEEESHPQIHPNKKVHPKKLFSPISAVSLTHVTRKQAGHCANFREKVRVNVVVFGVSEMRVSVWASANERACCTPGREAKHVVENP